jgi:hypothetical protein
VFSRSFIVISQRLLGTLIAGCFCVLNAAAGENAITTADRSVVRVIVKTGKHYGSGTGFVVSAGGIVVTNHHVVADSDVVWVLVKQPDSEPLNLPATITWISADYDLALLKVPGLNRPPLTISDQLPDKGSLVTSIGYPGVADRLGRNDKNLAESTVTQGIVGRVLTSSWLKGGQQLSILQHGAAVNSGNSGGPLLDTCGRVVGVNTQKALGTVVGTAAEGQLVNQTDGIFFASHVAVLLEALRRQGVTTLVSSEGCTTESVPAATTAPQPGRVDWVVPGAIGIAILVALVALTIALKKTGAVRETFTQYKSRSEPRKIESARAISTRKLILRGQDSTGRSVALLVDPARCKAGPHVIGRDSQSCELQIDDITVSRRHASITWSAGRWQLEDLGSTNGTWLDSTPVASTKVVLKEGQTLTLGKVTLKVEEART